MHDGMVNQAPGAVQPLNQLAGADHLGVVEHALGVLAFGSWSRGQDCHGRFALHEDAAQELGEGVSNPALVPHELIESFEPVR